ncbi:MAG: ATPase domain-containing protein [Pleurocapsa sp. MO_226.B13]|nr:ATPase domain-containing protein [Pleurocapsa sp. MO_226.B13]
MTLNRISTGIAGLDEILSGGLITEQTYLITGQPGSGKTTLGFHFLRTGVSQGERCLFISFSEPETRLRRNAELVGVDINDVEFLDLSPRADFFSDNQTYDIFSPAEVDKAPITKKIITAIDEVKPQRIFLDAITQFRFLSSDTFHFRKQVQSFLCFMLERKTTMLFTSEGSDRNPDDDLQFMSDGVIELRITPEQRRIRVAKFRGSDFISGYHELQLTPRGIAVFPRLIPKINPCELASETISSGIPEIDEMLHGGLEQGTTTIISGPSGVGKSTLGMQFIKETAGRGEGSVVYTFEEAKETILKRCQAVNIPVHSMIESGTLSILEVEPLKYTPNQFVHLVRTEVAQNNARVIMLDSTSGYKLSVQGKNLVPELHSLCQDLKSIGVTAILIEEVQMITGSEFSVTETGLGYLADNLIFLRYLELDGRLRKAIGVLKKRVSDCERTLREFKITKYGLKVGEPLTNLRGILSGVPKWINKR